MLSWKKSFWMVAILATFWGFNGCLQAQELPFRLDKALNMITQDGDLDGAYKLIYEELQANPKSSDAYFLSGYLKAERKKYGPAVVDFTSALQYYSKKTAIKQRLMYLYRARALSELHESEKARADYDKAVNLAFKAKDNGDIKDFLFEFAGFYYELDMYEKAEGLYRMVLEIDETNAMAMAGLGRNLLDTKKYEEALGILDKCVMYYPDYNGGYQFRMQVYDEMGKVSEAIDDAVNYLRYTEQPSMSMVEPIMKKNFRYALAKVNDAIKRASDDKFFWMNVRADIYTWQRNFDKAIEQYNELEKDYGFTPLVSSNRADAYAKMGCLDAAIADMTKVIESLTNESDWYYYKYYSKREGYYFSAARYEEAIADYDELIDRFPTLGYLYRGKGRCYKHLGKDAEALKYFNESIDVYEEGYSYLYRGRLYLKQGKKELAEADFRKVLELDTNGNAHTYALLYLGEVDKAIEESKQKVAKDDADYNKLYELVCVQSLAGKKDDAVKNLKKCVDLGFTHVAHIEHDDDLDGLREMPEYKEIIKGLHEYLDNLQCQLFLKEAEKYGLEVEVPIVRKSSKTYEIACTVNGLALKFIFDTGASDVTISSVEANFMHKNGYIKPSDIKGTRYYQTASGDIQAGTVITLREIKIGDAVLKNVDASVVPSQQAPLLLGQSVFDRFGTITIDNENSKVIIRQ